MLTLRLFAPLIAALLIIPAGCERKNRLPIGDNGSKNKKEESSKNQEVAQNTQTQNRSSAPFEQSKGKESSPVVPKKIGDPIPVPPKKEVGPPPDWDKVGKQEWAANEKVILSADDAQNYVPGTLRVSPDGGHFAYARKYMDGEAMFLDGRELMRLKNISPTLIEFSRDSKHLVYAGHRSDDEGYCWVRDDKISLMSKVEGLSPRYYVQKFFLTPDASEVGLNVNGNYAVVNNKYVSEAGASSVVFNTTEKLHFAILLLGKVKVDDVEQKQFEAISGFQFSDNGKNFAYIVTQSGEQFVVFGKSEERAYQKVDSLVLSPDGKRYAHRVEHEGKQYLVIDGKPKAYAGSFKRSVLFSPDSSRWATVFNERVIVDHALDHDRDATGLDIDANSLNFSPDSRHFAYFATKDGSRIVILDGKGLGAYHAIAKVPLFSADGQSLAYLAQADKDGKWAVYVNGKKVSDVPHDPQGRWVLEFSPDSRSIGYAASVDLVWHILLDGKLIEKNEPIGAEGTRIGFGPDGSFTYVVKRKNAYYWVTEKRKG